jgi:hypothetical protein
MLRFVSNSPFAGRGISRRAWLQLGGWTGLNWLASKRGEAGETTNPRAIPGFGRAKSVVLVYTSGGQSQLETWDPKPDAPDGIRGEFKPIQTTVPGTMVCEHLPRLSQLADRYTILRSVSHEDLDHGSATHLALTGHYHPKRSSNPPPSPNDSPTYGAVLKRVRPNTRFPYDAIHVNAPAYVPQIISPGQDGGTLGRDFEPLVVGDVSSAALAIPCLDVQVDLPIERLESRLELRQTFDQLHERHDDRLTYVDHAYRQALDLLASPQSRRAFDLSEERSQVRDRYGRHRSGQACLLARRLVEAGVPFINVIWNHSNRGQDLEPDNPDVYGWDTHNDIFDLMKNHLLPRFDVSFSALLEDLDERGLLDQTLVVCMGEFGRAPRIALEAKFKGRTPGRKHWSSVYSAVVAGAGVTRGAVVGASDSIGGHVASNPVGPWNLAATMFASLGIDPRQHYQDALGRPFPICTGSPIRRLYES